MGRWSKLNKIWSTQLLNDLQVHQGLSNSGSSSIALLLFPIPKAGTQKKQKEKGIFNKNLLRIEKLYWPSLQCATETSFKYWEPKPRSNFGIGIRAETFFSKLKLFFLNFFKLSHFFLCLLVACYKFLKAKVEHRPSKIVKKSLICGRKVGVRGFCMTPCYW